VNATTIKRTTSLRILIILPLIVLLAIPANLWSSQAQLSQVEGKMIVDSKAIAEATVIAAQQVQDIHKPSRKEQLKKLLYDLIITMPPELIAIIVGYEGFEGKLQYACEDSSCFRCIRAIVPLRDHNYVVSAGMDFNFDRDLKLSKHSENVSVWDVVSGKCIQIIPAAKGLVKSLAALDNNAFVATTLEDKEDQTNIKVWSPDSKGQWILSKNLRVARGIDCLQVMSPTTLAAVEKSGYPPTQCFISLWNSQTWNRVMEVCVLDCPLSLKILPGSGDLVYGAYGDCGAWDAKDRKGAVVILDKDTLSQKESFTVNFCVDLLETLPDGSIIFGQKNCPGVQGEPGSLICLNPQLKQYYVINNDPLYINDVQVLSNGTLAMLVRTESAQAGTTKYVALVVDQSSGKIIVLSNECDGKLAALAGGKLIVSGLPDDQQLSVWE
jgi:WD40 repeat protein